MKKIIIICVLYSISFLEGKICLDIKDSNFTPVGEEKRLENENILLNFNKEDHQKIILTDYHIKEAFQYKRKNKKVIAWLIEPRCIVEHTGCYFFVEKYIRLFDYVLTFDEKLLSKFPDKCLFFPALPGKFIKRRGIPNIKNKICSYITSSKNWTEGHKFRQDCLAVFKNFFKDYKDGNVTIPYKDPYLDEYFFSVVVENNLNQNYYFSEKIIECFEKGVIPIYAGPRGVEKFFHEEGVIRFNSLIELEKILKNLTPEDYFKKFEFVQKNFEISKEYNWDSFLNRLYLALNKLDI